MAMPKGQLELKLKEEHEMITSGVLREENPLDLSSDFADFLQACRSGDLKQCQLLISAGVNINGKDEFDYTPLIIASLCGHYEVAELLLESGALAERNTFQGERCLYNALNDRIRNLLLRYDYSKSSDPLQPWASHITSLFTASVPKTSDITLTTSPAPGLEPDEFQLHKFLLAARTPYFRRKLTEAPDMQTWKLSRQIPAGAVSIVLRYLYLDDVSAHTAALGDDDDELIRGMDKISKQLEVEQLWEAILASTDRRLARQRYQDEVERAQKQVQGFFRQHVLGNRITVDASKAHEVRWPHDNFIFADCLLQADEADEEDEDEAAGTAPQNSEQGGVSQGGIPVGPPAAAQAADAGDAHGAAAAPAARKQRRSVLFPAHKALLVRSDYFRTMFCSAFREAQPAPHLRIIPVDCAPDVLEIVLSFLYTEQADIPLDLALDVLYVADMLFLERLKTKAAVIISTLGNGSRNVLDDPTRGSGPVHGAQEDQDRADYEINIFDVLRAAWDLRVQRLEDFAARFLAQRLEDYIDAPAFADAVLESAHRLRTRHETDSIELVDDIRYFLSERFRLRFEEMALSDMDEGDAGDAGDGTQGDVQADARAATAVDKAAATVTTDTPSSVKPAATDEQLTAAVIRTLDGIAVEDEFDSDALNYKILLDKIDLLLSRLGLDG